MGPWKKFESTIVRLKRSYEDTGSVVCLTTKGRQLERNFEELKPASHVPILGTILNIFDVFVAVKGISISIRSLLSSFKCISTSTRGDFQCFIGNRRNLKLHKTDLLFIVMFFSPPVTD